MKNPATNKPPRDDFNRFTRAIKNECDQLAGHSQGRNELLLPLVTLRNGNKAIVHWFDDDGPEYEMFASGDCSQMRWYNDGTSVHHEDLDMMEM